MDSRLNGLTLKTSLSALLDLVLPRVCLVCGQVLIPQERHLCMACLADLPETYYATLPHNPMADRFNGRIQARLGEYEPYVHATALFHYRADAGYKRISQALKYHRNFAAGRYFARMLGRRLAASSLYADVDLVVPVPLHWTRRWQRGYNQAEVIAREVAGILGRPFASGLLRRKRRTRSQARLSGEAKLHNVEGAFVLRKGRLPAAAHILLVDDVFTTGATLAACHTALRKHYGPRVRISVATLGAVGE